MRVPILIFALLATITAALQEVPRTESASSPTSALPLISTTTIPIPTHTSIEKATITEAPELDVSLEGVTGIELQEKWHLTTYTTCVTLGSYIGCGVHEPVLPGGDEVAGAEGRRARGWVVGGVAVGVGLLLR